MTIPPQTGPLEQGECREVRCWKGWRRQSEDALPHSPTTVKTIWGYLTLDEQRGMRNLLKRWGEEKFLDMWESLRWQVQSRQKSQVVGIFAEG